MPFPVRVGSADGEPEGAFVRGGVRLPTPSAFYELARYFVVSVLALGADVGLLMALVRSIHYALAASLSFLAGAVVHYLLSVAFVFRRRRLVGRRGSELAIFVGAGILALGINTGVIALGVELVAMPLLAAKAVAAVCSFAFGYALRKRVLF